jgi:acyl carrier protein
MSLSDTAILAELISILKGMTDWEYSEPITRETRFFADLGFESIDAVVIGELIETHYRQRFPYAQFLAELGQRGQRDMQLGELVDFLRRHLNSSARQEPAEEAR